MKSKKNLGRTIVGWFKNTTIDPDKIMDFFGVAKDKKVRNELRKVAAQIRKEQFGG